MLLCSNTGMQTVTVQCNNNYWQLLQPTRIDAKEQQLPSPFFIRIHKIPPKCCFSAYALLCSVDIGAYLMILSEPEFVKAQTSLHFYPSVVGIIIQL